MKRQLLVVLILSFALCRGFAGGGQEAASGRSGENLEVEAVAWGSGNYETWFRAVAEEMRTVYPQLTYNIWSTTRFEELQPRIVAGDPPDIIQGNMSQAKQGLFVPLDDILDAPAYDSELTLRETFLPGSLDRYQFDGKTWLIPREPGMLGLWYDEVLFTRYGWTVPETWEEFLALCEQIKADGQVPFTYQGLYPYYLEILITPLIYKTAGEQAFRDINNLVPGAWKNPDVMRAIELAREFMTTPGNVLAGTEGLNHTASQIEWLNHSAVFLPCGTWLEDEMADVIPDGFQMRLMLVPGPSGGKGDNNALVTYVYGGYGVMADGNVEYGKEFVRIMASKKMAQEWARITGMFLPVKGGTDGVQMTPAFTSAHRLLEQAETTIEFYAHGWYPTFRKVYDSRIADVLWGRMTVDHYTDLLEAEAARILADDEIEKQFID